MARGRTRTTITTIALTTLFLSVPAGMQVAAAETPDCAAFDNDLLQVVKASTDASLVTMSATEAAAAATRFGFTDDRGTLAQVATSRTAETVAVWRLYRAGDFVWATEGAEVDQFVADGYAKQFVAFYAAMEPSSCLGVIYRLELDGKHRLAGDDEAKRLVAAGWTREKVAFYADLEAPAAGQPNDPTDDARFSIAMIPDTQNEVVNPLDARFRNRATWLANNKAALDLRYAIQIGDLVDWGDAVPAQFDKAGRDIAPLEAAMPWSGAIGNHDTAAVCVGGSACIGANANVAVRDTSAYNRVFGVSRFDNVAGTFENNKIDNSYKTFWAGGENWLVMSLELWPRKAAIEWAKTVVAANPDHNVIVVTHAYLNGNGSIGTSNGGYGATSPQYLYDNLIKLYPNVKIVASGHVGMAASRTDIGVNGNKILSLLQTFHSSTNPVRIVEVDTRAGTVNSRVYAPATDTDYDDYSTATTGLDFDR